MHKAPACNLTGIWHSHSREIGSFAIWTSETGTLIGFSVRNNSCKIFGRISAHRVRFEQFWMIKRYLITSLEGFVSETGSKMLLYYSVTKPDGMEKEGVIVLRKERHWGSDVSDLLKFNSDDWCGFNA